MPIGQNRLARRAAGRPYGLKLAVTSGRADGVLTVPGIAYHDELIAVLEFRNMADAAEAIAADHTANATVTGNGTVTISGGSTIARGHSVLVIYFDFID